MPEKDTQLRLVDRGHWALVRMCIPMVRRCEHVRMGKHTSCRRVWRVLMLFR